MNLIYCYSCEEKFSESKSILWKTRTERRSGEWSKEEVIKYSPPPLSSTVQRRRLHACMLHSNRVTTGPLLQWLLQLADHPRVQRLRLQLPGGGDRGADDGLQLRRVLPRARPQQGARWKEPGTGDFFSCDLQNIKLHVISDFINFLSCTHLMTMTATQIQVLCLSSLPHEYCCITQLATPLLSMGS